MDGEKPSETPKDAEADFLANAGEVGVRSGGLTPNRNDDNDGKEKEPDNETTMPPKSFFDDFLSSRSSQGNNEESKEEGEEEEEEGTGLRRRVPSSVENLDNPASRELYELKKQLESLKGELEQERRSKSSLLRKKERKKRKSKKRLQKRRARRSSDSDEDYDPGPLDDSPDAWEMERLPIDDSVDASPIRYDAAHGFFTGASHPGVLSPLDTSVDLQNTDLQALARQRMMQQGGESEQSLIDQSGFLDQSSLMDQSSMMDQSAMMENQETTSSSYDSSSSSDSDSDSEVDMIGGGEQGQGEGTSEGDLYNDEEDGLYNIPSSTSSSSDSDDVQDEEFIFVPNSKKFEKRKKKKKKKKKERKRQRQREMEEKYYQDEEAGPGGVGGGGGAHGGPPRNSEDEYYVRDSKPFYDYTQTVYGSFQKDLAANAKKFAEEIHRKKKHKPPTHFFEGIVDRVWGLEENLKLKATHTFVWFYLICLGVFSALIGVAMDYAIIFIQQGHYYVTDQFTDDYWLRYMIWILYLLFFAGASMLSTRIAPTAQGSGIPEMKAILSGVNLRKYLTFNTLIAKILSITFSVGSGLVLGKVGPFIHTCATLANQLARLPLFHRIRENGYLLQQMLAVGCTMGVASNFGAPVGGVLFSIEVTSTYYPLNTYASAFKCAIVGALVFRYFWFDTSYIPTNFDLQSWAYAEIPWFIILGLFEGILGAFFIHFFAKVVERRRWFASLANNVQSTATKQFLTFCNHPYVYGMMVALLTGIATYPGLAKFVSLPHIFALQDLFNDRALDDNDMNANDWSEGGTLLLNLFIFMIIRLLFLTISISMPLSSGVFLPLLVTGAAIGRFWGEFLEQNLPQVKYDINNIELFGWHIAPGGYALVGAAGLAGAATQTFSTAVIILEICGQLSFALPIVITVVIAVSVARMFSISIYDKISITRGLPWLPELPQSMYHMTVADVMKTNVQFLTYDATPQKIAKLLANPEKHKIYPIVNNASSMMVVGLVTRKDLLRYLLQSSTVRDWHTPVTMESNVSDSREVIPGLTEENRRVLPIKPATVQLFASTPLANCQMLFITLRLSDAFVTSNSKLVGIVTRNDLRMAIGQADFSPVWNFFRGIWGGFWGICFRR